MKKQKEDRVLKVGEYWTINSGEYSDYTTLGIVQITKPCTTGDLDKEYREWAKKHWDDEPKMYGFDEDMSLTPVNFLFWLTTHSTYAREVSFQRLHVGCTFYGM